MLSDNLQASTTTSPYRSKWIEQIFQDKQETRLHEIFIPGTHDSATYNISTDSDVADIELDEKGQQTLKTALKVAWSLGSLRIKLPREPFVKWAKAQSVTIKQQLETGIRFFDLRPCVKHYNSPNNIDWWISHSIFSVPLDEVLRDIQDFLDKNSYEIVILDLRFIWGLSQLDRTVGSKALYQKICDYLGEERLIKLPPNSTIPTIGEIWKTSGRVLLLWDVSGNPKGSGVSQEFMKEHHFQDTINWAYIVGEGDEYNTSHKKIQRISQQLQEKQREEDFCLVKCEIDVGDSALDRISGSLEELAESNKSMISHIQDEWSKRRKGAIFTFDYYNNCGVADTIIKLNG